MPHVVAVGMWSHNPEHDAINVTGRDFERTNKFREVEGPGRAGGRILKPWPQTRSNSI